METGDIIYGDSCCCQECAKLIHNLGIRHVYYYKDSILIKDNTKNILSYAKPSSGTWSRRPRL